MVVFTAGVLSFSLSETEKDSGYLNNLKNKEAGVNQTPDPTGRDTTAQGPTQEIIPK